MRILLISDVHANPWALVAVGKDAGNVDHILCAGDCITYGTRPIDAIAWLREHGTITVRGNHDDAVAFHHHPRASPAKAHLALALRDWTQAKLEPPHIQWLARLPLIITWEISGARFVMVHATPPDPLYDYRLTPNAPHYVLTEILTGFEADFVVLGHTHLPYVRTHNRMTVVNPGSVGQPLDGDPRAAYAIWEDGEVTLHRAAYDQGELIKSLDELGLENDLYGSLRRSFELGKMI
ncbi:MAG: metallophosphoesterase family protein [Phycisphaerae bacterium]